MASLKDLENAINKLLNHPSGAGQFHLPNHVDEKAYEAYIYCLCLRAVRELGATPILRGISGPPTPFVFRGAPSQIHSTNWNYGYAEFSLNSHVFEVHAGVEFVGTSGMTHELDVCIMRAADARACRTPGSLSDPPAASLVGAWECKFYAGTLNKSLGRAFVGLVDDMGSNMRLNGMCSNSQNVQLKNYFQPQRRPYPHFELTPLAPSNEDIFVNAVKGELKKMTSA